MKISITLIACSISLLLAYSLQAGFEKQGLSKSKPTHFYKTVELLLCDVQKGTKEKDDLNKPIESWHERYLYTTPIPLVGLAAEVDEESLQLMEQLLKAGADPNTVRTQTGISKSALEMALRYGLSQGVQLLLQYGANAKENSHMVQQLAGSISNGMHLRFSSLEEFRRREAEIMKHVCLLLEYGADVNTDPRLYATANLYGQVFCHLINDYVYFHPRQKKYAPGEVETDPTASKEKEAYDCTRTLIKLFLRRGANPYKGRDPGKFYIGNDLDNAERRGASELSRYIAQGRRVYWITRLLSGKKEGGSFGPFPVEIAEHIACLEDGFSWNALEG